MSDDSRTPPPQQSGERAALAGFLQWQRDTLALKCAVLTAEQLRGRHVPPSQLSLLGLVRHLAEVERSWFRNVFLGGSSTFFWATPQGERAAFDVGSADPDEGFRVWREECARSRATGE